MVSTRRSMSFGPMMMCSLVAIGCASSSSADGLGGEAQAVTGKGTGRFERWQRVEMAVDGLTFKRTELDPASGNQDARTSPEQYAITVDGKSFWLLSFGEADIRCGTIARNAEGASFDGDSGERCGFGRHYEPNETDALAYERRERIDLDEGRFTRTLLDPWTGRTLGAHPETFVVEGGDVYTTGEKRQKCGTITVTGDAVTFKGCGLWKSYAARK